jgi:hypothetical protein
MPTYDRSAQTRNRTSNTGSAVRRCRQAARRPRDGAIQQLPGTRPRVLPSVSERVASSARPSPRRDVFALIIVGEARGQETSQIPLAEDDHVVQTLAPNGSDQSHSIRIVPRT